MSGRVKKWSLLTVSQARRSRTRALQLRTLVAKHHERGDLNPMDYFEDVFECCLMLSGVLPGRWKARLPILCC